MQVYRPPSSSPSTLDVVRRLAVHRLARHRTYCDVPLRRGRLVRRLALPHARRGRAPRPHRQVERRLRRDGRADDAARRLRRRSRRTPATRCSSSATCREFRDTVRALRDDYGGSFERFWADFRSRPALTKSSDHYLLNTYAMAACYSAERRRHGATCPSTRRPASCARTSGQRWLALGPGAHGRSRHAEALRSLRAIYIDAGKRDEYFLDLGAEAFRRELEKLGDHRRLLRALRREARGDRVPLPARAPLPRRAPPVAQAVSCRPRGRA